MRPAAVALKSNKSFSRWENEGKFTKKAESSQTGNVGCTGVGVDSHHCEDAPPETSADSSRKEE
jgi:hypothetical protein